MKAACTRHTALLLHRMTHNHSPKIRELATMRLRTKQARNACPRRILHRTVMPTDTGKPHLESHTTPIPHATPRHPHYLCEVLVEESVSRPFGEL